MNHLIDRRLAGGNKSAVNRERFLRRYKEQIRRSVKGVVAERSITDIDKGGNVNIPARDIREPVFRHGPGGEREIVHTGNKEFSAGDTIPRPQGGGEGQGRGNQGGEGESVDDFVFTLSREEFLDLFFEDMELPDMVRNFLGDVPERKWVRAGYRREGSPNNLAVVRTLKQSLGRRIALSSAIRDELEAARRELAEAERRSVSVLQVSMLRERVEELEKKLSRVPFLDDLDLRYRNRVAVPAPVARAVMFCLMDVSASMDERKKELAKRFYALLYLFLTRKYEHVELVFIRHTDNAEECDEDAFFHDPRTGGTVVCSALELMHKIVDERFEPAGWNIYAAQASDGDAFGSDPAKSMRYLREFLLPLARYFAYIEIPDENDNRTSTLWAAYEELAGTEPNFAMRRVHGRAEIYPVFRDLFKKETAWGAA